jgi:hypothetical protein
MCAQRPRARKGRPRQPIPKTLPGNLYDYADDPAPALGRQRGSQAHISDVETLRVVDDWPEQVPVTEAEIRVFERWFGDVFDELFSPVKPKAGLNNLSTSDKDKP